MALGKKMYTRKELAEAYGINPKTLTTRIRELGILTRNRLTPKQINHIFAELGEPV